MKIRFKPLLGGLTTSLLPPIASVMARRNYPHVEAEYYYRVWLNHVRLAQHYGMWAEPETVLEIGPGSSLGVGVAALLSGVRRYWAYDANSLRQGCEEPRLLPDLVHLYQQQAAFAEAEGWLPSTILPPRFFAAENANLAPKRLRRIKDSLARRSDLIAYHTNASAIPENSVDFLFSHSVLEHVDELELFYQKMWRWLKPGGTMTHSIDFTAHGTSTLWNGHWTIPAWLWRLQRGKRLYFLNREPISRHQVLLAQHGFALLGVHVQSRFSHLTNADLATPFRQLSEVDLTTASAFLIAHKPL